MLQGFVHWFETSAKDGTGIEDAAIFLVKKIIEQDVSERRGDNQKISGPVGKWEKMSHSCT